MIEDYLEESFAAVGGDSTTVRLEEEILAEHNASSNASTTSSLPSNGTNNDSHYSDMNRAASSPKRIEPTQYYAMVINFFL